jgi:hypothetical protein
VTWGWLLTNSSMLRGGVLALALQIPGPRGERLQLPSKDPGPRSRPSSWKGLGFRYGASVPALREPSIGRVVLRGS